MSSKKKNLSRQQKKHRKELKKKQDENISISASIFDITNSFLQKKIAPGVELPLMEQIVPFAIIGWNWSLIPKENQESLYNSIGDVVPPEIDAIGVVSLIELIDIFAKEKRLLFPDVKKMVKDYKFRTDEFGEKFLDVTSVDIED